MSIPSLGGRELWDLWGAGGGSTKRCGRRYRGTQRLHSQVLTPEPESRRPQMFTASLFTTAEERNRPECASADGRGSHKPPVRTPHRDSVRPLGAAKQ